MKFKLKADNGQVLLVMMILFTAIVTTVVVGVAAPIVRQIQAAKNLTISKQSFFAAESLAEDLAYRFKNGKSVSASESLAVGGADATASATTAGSAQHITAVGNTDDAIRSVHITLSLGTGIAFNFGVQAGEGGFYLDNTSSVSGNVYSAGPVVGAGGNIIRGDVISSGQSGLVYGIYATSSIYAHTIGNASKSTTIDKSAYYAMTITNTTVRGSEFPGSTDPETKPLPISDEQIAEWEADAAAGGIISGPCPYKLSSETITLGPVKIECDVQIQGSSDVTLSGPVWVEGTLEIQNTSALRVDPLLEGTSIAIIADDPSDTEGSGRIVLQNSTEYHGAGEGSFILLVSQNRSAENGNGTKAIEVKNTATGDLLVYAGHGEISLQNSVNLNEVTGYKIRLQNSANVVYDAGLPSTLFEAGPSGGYTISGWNEVE